MQTTFSRKPAVKHRLGDISDSTLYSWIRSGLMVSGIPVGPNTVVWSDEEINAVLAARLAGKSDDQVRSLVAALEDGRKAVA